MALVYVCLVYFLCVSAVFCKPLDSFRNSEADFSRVAPRALAHRVFRRFINNDNKVDDVKELGKYLGRPYRSTRSAKECEKLRLCKLHSSADSNIFSSFQLYFVSKENAKLWDHQNHKMADCDRLYGDCYGGEGQRHTAPESEIEFGNSDDY